MKFTLHRLPFTMHSPFTIHRKGMMDNVRKMENGKLLTALLGLIVICCAQLPNHTSAASPSASTSKAPTGITISPAFSQLKISATETEHPIQFKITNNEQQPTTLEISTADFNALNESGGLLFVGTNPTELQKKYGLAKWIRLSETSITIQPKETKNIDATIVNDPDLSPGGHYGALMLSLPNSDEGNAQNKVAIHSIASSLLFVTKAGGETYKLQLTNVDSSHSIFSLPDSVTLRFRNNGNSHLIPRGTVTITSPSGDVVSKGIINQDSAIILPETYRRYTVLLNKVSNATMPGKYKVTVDFRFDGYEQFRTYQTSQFLLAPTLLLLVFAVIAIIVSIFAFFTLKNRKFRSSFSKLTKRFRK